MNTYPFTDAERAEIARRLGVIGRADLAAEYRVQTRPLTVDQREYIKKCGRDIAHMIVRLQTIADAASSTPLNVIVIAADELCDQLVEVLK